MLEDCCNLLSLHRRLVGLRSCRAENVLER